MWSSLPYRFEKQYLMYPAKKKGPHGSYSTRKKKKTWNLWKEMPVVTIVVNLANIYDHHKEWINHKWSISWRYSCSFSLLGIISWRHSIQTFIIASVSEFWFLSCFWTSFYSYHQLLAQLGFKLINFFFLCCQIYEFKFKLYNVCNYEASIYQIIYFQIFLVSF